MTDGRREPGSKEQSGARTVEQRLEIGRASIDIMSYEAAVVRILDLARKRDSVAVVTPNADHVVMLESNPDLRAAYADAGLVLCDGMPLLWASRFLGTPLPERVPGSDLLPGLCKRGAPAGISVALIGGPPGAAEKAGAALTAAYPGLRVVWTDCPPVGFELEPAETERITGRLDQLSPDLVFVGVGAPKQELWIHRHRRSFRAGVVLGVGAAIEFAAGTVPRAPRWMRRVGIEWLFRLMTEPRRLWRRYLKDLVFFGIVFRQRLARSRPNSRPPA